MASQPLVVLDAANVVTVVRGAVRIQRLQNAIDHFESLGIRCIAFAPGYWVKSKALTPRGRHQVQQSPEMELDQKAEMVLVQQLVLADKVVLTPPQAHDDLFIIDYAIKHSGFVVTNDMFRDHVASKMVFHGKELTEAWVKSHCITFTFVGAEFLPSAQHMQALMRQKQPTPKIAKVVNSPRSRAVEVAPTIVPSNASAPKPSGAKKSPIPAASSSSKARSPRAKSASPSRDNNDTNEGHTKCTESRVASALTIVTSPSQQPQANQSPEDDLSVSFEEEVRASLHPATLAPAAQQKQQRKTRTPGRSRSSTPRNTGATKASNMYRNLDDASASSDDDKSSRTRTSHDEVPHESRPNVLNEWNLLQSIIAKSNPPTTAVQASNNQDDIADDAPKTKESPSAPLQPQLDVDEVDDATKPLSPSQRKRGRRRANAKKQAAATMVYRVRAPTHRESVD